MAEIKTGQDTSGNTYKEQTSDMVINQISEAKLQAKKNAGTIEPNQIFFTPDEDQAPEFDEKPTEGNTNNLVSSDSLYKYLPKVIDMRTPT